MSRTLQIVADWRLQTVDQTLLPFDHRLIELDSAQVCREAIVQMQVRGAPLIGAVGAFGLAFGLREDASDAALAAAVDWLGQARPTAINLRWALDRVDKAVKDLAPSRRAQAAWQAACEICEEDVRCNHAIGRLGAELLAKARRSADKPLQILTHCNAGSLATIEYGTALAPLYTLHQAGMPLHVWVDETRPRNQGASLTAWELSQAGIAHTVIADNAGGLMMMQGEVDAVIVGCDRVAANGDVANKIGTYLKALAARDNGIPFYVACPMSTLDPHTPDGGSIPIEFRGARELTHARGQLSGGEIVEVALMSPQVQASNPAFDITPARLVSALITERGAVAAQPHAIAALYASLGNTV